MAASLMEKLTNFLMPLEEEEEIAAAPVRQSKNPPQLTVHEGAARRGEEFSITVVVPRAYENVCSGCVVPDPLGQKPENYNSNQHLNQPAEKNGFPQADEFAYGNFKADGEKQKNNSYFGKRVNRVQV